MYTSTRLEHSLKEIRPDDNLLTLEDGSLWRIYNGYQDMIRGWREDEMISVKKSRDPQYPYKLVNMHCNESVEAIYKGE